MKRPLKIGLCAAGIVFGLLALTLAAALVAANTEGGRAAIERAAKTLSDGEIVVRGLAGRFPDRLRVTRIELRDDQGPWLTIDDLELDWAPLYLAFGEASIGRLAAARVEMMRPMPDTGPGGFSLPVAVDLGSLDIVRLDFAAAVAGTDMTFAVHGTGHLDSLERGRIGFAIEGFQDDGRYRIDADFDAATVNVQLAAQEPPDGLFAHLAGLEQLGEITLDATVNGPRSHAIMDLSLRAAALNASMRGRLDLIGEAADLSLQVDGAEMHPRPDIGWRSLLIEGRVTGPLSEPTAEGTVAITGLSAGGTSLDSADASVTGDSGHLHMKASLNGLGVPGADRTLLSGAPVMIDATLRLDRPERPLAFSVRHPLIGLQGTAELETKRLTASLDLPDLKPFAAIGGIDLIGRSRMAVNASERDGATTIEANGTLAVAGGAAPLPALLGKAAHIELSATLSGDNVTDARLGVDGTTLRLGAQGSVVAGRVALDWSATLSDLSVFATDLSGSMKAAGHVGGRDDDLAATADAEGFFAAPSLPRAPVSAHLDVTGLPSAPRGRIDLRGMLAQSPVTVAASARPSGDGVTRVAIERAAWKSAHAEGGFTLAPKTVFPAGTLNVQIDRLADLGSLIAAPLKGTLTAEVHSRVDRGRADLRFNAGAKGVTMPGAISVDAIELEGSIRDLASKPVVDAELATRGIVADGVTGGATLTARGALQAVELKLAVAANDGGGDPLQLSGTAGLDVGRKQLDFTALEARWKDETLRLLRPARVAFGDGIRIARLRLGIREGVLTVDGRVTPELNLDARLQQLPAAIAESFVPGLGLTGTIAASARLAGTIARPDGTVRVEASELRLAGVGRSLPAGRLTATARLAQEAATVDAHLNLGVSTNLTVTGQVPMDAARQFNLRTEGQADLALANPVLGARGRRIGGQLELRAAVSGTRDHPAVNGTISLGDGAVQDYNQGVDIEAIEGLFQLENDRVRIAHLDARAGPGRLSAVGTLDLLQPGMPLDLALKAENARPLASDLLTVNLDADLTVTGSLTRKFLLAGEINIDQADIRIPETLPASVATLDVRRSGRQPPPPAAVIDLDLAIAAPGRIFVRGRGLDAELNGNVRVRGTTLSPEPIGAFKMVRGRIDLAGRTLAFRKGKVSFDGGRLTNPSLDFTAGTISGGVSAELNVGGTLNDPKITLRSSPELPQDEIVAQLLFGRSASALSPFELAAIASALAELTGMTPWNADLLGSVGKDLGLDRLSLGSGSSGRPTLEAGLYVAPNIYVGVEQGVTAASTRAKVQVDLTKHLKLEGTVGTGSGNAPESNDPTGETGGSVGATYQFEY